MTLVVGERHATTPTTTATQPSIATMHSTNNRRCIHESIALQRSYYPSSPDERQHRHDASASAKSQQPRPRHRPQRHVRGHVALRANAGRSRHVDTQRITSTSSSMSSAIEQVDGSRHMSVLGTQAGAPASARVTAAACFVRAYEREGSEWSPMNTQHAAPSIARCVGRDRRSRCDESRDAWRGQVSTMFVVHATHTIDGKTCVI
jgi:hypothetical protein